MDSAYGGALKQRRGLDLTPTPSPPRRSPSSGSLAIWSGGERTHEYRRLGYLTAGFIPSVRITKEVRSAAMFPESGPFSIESAPVSMWNSTLNERNRIGLSELVACRSAATIFRLSPGN